MPPENIQETEKDKRRHEVALQLRPVDHSSKKRSFFGQLCSACFETRLLVSKYDREVFIRTTLIELAVYIAYLTLTCFITYGMTSPNLFYYTSVISDLFLDQPFHRGEETTFRTSSTVEDFWEFAETSMVKGLYWHYWYGVTDTDHAIPPQDQGILYENRLLGRPRFRQIRVKVDKCPIAENFTALFRDCYPPYSYAAEETQGFHYHSNTDLKEEDAWHYHSEEELQGTSHWGRLATYRGSGAFQLLGTQEEETLAILKKLKNELWITRATRVVFLDFTVYNANVNLFCIVKLVWEFPPTGGLVTTWSIEAIGLIIYDTLFEYFLILLQVLFVLFTLYYTIQEVVEMCTAKCSKYVHDLWSYLDILIICLSCSCIGYTIYRHVVVQRLILPSLLAESDTFVNVYWFAFWEARYNNAVAILVFLAWIKLFKYVSFNKTMSQLSSTMSRCAKDVGGFAIMFFIVFFAFAQLGYLLFGSQAEDFRTFADTTFALLRLILGDFDFRAILEANRILGPVFFVTYVFFVFFVLLNMFLAIINDTYSQVKAEEKAHVEQYQVTDYIKRRFNSFCGHFGYRSRKLDLQHQVKLANAENIITNEELRENLKQSHYTDVEVEMFLARYELDEERPLDEDEAENALGSLEGYHAVDLRGDEEIGREEGTKENPGTVKVTEMEVGELQSRVAVVESTLTTVTSKLDELLYKLDQVYGDGQNSRRKTQEKQPKRASVQSGDLF